MDKEFAGGALFEKPKWLIDEEGLYGTVEPRKLNDVNAYVDQNPFLKDHPFFRELMERERFYMGYTRDVNIRRTEVEDATLHQAQDEATNTEAAPAGKQAGSASQSKLENELPEGVSPAGAVEPAPADPVAAEPIPEAPEVENESTEEPATQAEPAQKEAERPAAEAAVAEAKAENQAAEGEAMAMEGQQPKEAEEPVAKKEFKAESTDEFMDELSAAKPSELIQGAQQAPSLVPNLENKEKDTLKENLPEIEKPTGLPAYGEGVKQKVTPKLPTEGKQPEINTPEQATSQAIDTEHKSSDKKTIKETSISAISGKEGTVDADEAKAEIRRLPTKDSSITTHPGPAPKVKLTNEADPAQNEANQATSDETAAKELAESQQATLQDFGEQDIYPEVEAEMLSPNVELQPVPELNMEGMAPMPEVDAETLNAFDTQAKQQMDEQLAAEKQKQADAYQKMEADSAKAREENESKIAAETESIRAQQEAEQQKAQEEVGKHRADWQAENEKAKAEYHEQAAAKKAETEGQIDQEVASANERVAVEFKAAEQEAKAKEREAQAKAQAEKDEAEKKESSWWDKAVDAVSSAINKIKDAINKIFDALRAAVKRVIEAAKKLANTIIDAARNAVVGLIKLFAEALKALVSTLLAAFPELAEKFNALIDRAVNAAVKIVNDLAEGLKKAVSALLDILGATLDGILAAYQAAFNLILDAVKFIAVGLGKILQGIANLVFSAKMSPDHFFGQLSEELLGQDVTKPLPNERAPVEAAAASGMLSEAAPDLGQQDVAILDKQTSYTSDQVEVDQVINDAQLDPALMAQIAAMPEGSEVEFGASEDQEHSMDAVKQDAVQAEQEMAAESTATEPQAATAGPATTGGEGMVGPFNSPAERAAHLVGTMTKAVGDWFKQNWPSILLAGVAGITGIILLNLLTGGAIMAALPVLLQIFSAVMAAEGIYQTGKHFAGYLGKAWPGNLAEGAKMLARGLAAVAIELAFSLLFGAKAAFKGAKTAVRAVSKRGVKGAAKLGAKVAKRRAVRSARKTITSGKEMLQSGANAAVRGGKVAMKGVRKGFAKGAKTLDDLGQRLAKKLRFKKFRLRVKNKRFKLEGEVNPWVLLANGEVKYVDDPNLGKVGDKVKVDGEAAFIVGKNSSKGAKTAKDAIEKGGTSRYVSDLVALSDNQKALKAKFDTLDKATDVRKQIYGSSDPAWFKDPKIPDSAKNAAKKRGDLRKKLNTKAGDEAHHAISVSIIGQSRIVQDAIEAGFKFNTKANGINLKKYSKSLKLDGVHAYHPSYTAGVLDVLERFNKSFGRRSGYSSQHAVDFAETLSKKLISKIEDICIGKGVKVEDLFKENISGITKEQLYKETILDMKGKLPKR